MYYVQHVFIPDVGGGGGGGDKSYIILTEVLFMQNLMSLSSGCR